MTNQPSIDWARLERALSQDARKNDVPPDRLETVIKALPKLIGACGYFSQTRKVAYRVGHALLFNWPATIYVPICPAHSHHKGSYTFKSVSGGLPLLIRTHTPFLLQFQKALPNAIVQFLLADFEADNVLLCRHLSVSREEFLDRIHRSIKTAASHVRRYGWQVSAMSEAIPEFSLLETEAEERIRCTPSLQPMLENDTLFRHSFYQRIGYSPKDYLSRTIAIAAQYVALGGYCEERRYLVANHHTPSLTWYLRSGVGFLHNPTVVK